MVDMEKFSLNIGVDDVLRGQGADPDVIRSRSPHLVDVAEKALSESKGFLNPQVVTRSIRVDSVLHNKIILENKIEIRNPVLVNQFMGAESIVAVLCTVGPEIDTYAAEVMSKSSNMLLGLAIDGVGSAGVEALANEICAEIELDSKRQGLNTTIPLSPGMIGWQVDEGQPLIFSLLKSSEIGVELTDYYLMKPRKSLSMLIGIGKNITSEGSICQYCAMNETCQYKEHNELTAGDTSCD
jgi:hypothetical protein